jgi:hypothetical protein
MKLPKGTTVKYATDAKPGDVAMYTTAHAPGAYANGSRVRKATFHPGDAHPVGALGTVVGSLGPIDVVGRREFGYFVVWDKLPGVPVFVRGGKVELEKGQ